MTLYAPNRVKRDRCLSLFAVTQVEAYFFADTNKPSDNRVKSDGKGFNQSIEPFILRRKQ